MTEPLKIGVLLSGSGTNLQAIIDAAAEGLPVEIVHVVSSRPDAFGIERAHRAGIPVTVLNRCLLYTADVYKRQSFVCDAAHLYEAEALKTFNMGLGMVLIVDAARADEVEAALTQAGETTYRVGRIVAGEGEVRYANDGKLYGFGAEA